MGEYPAPATLVVTDAEGFSDLTDPEQRALRAEMYTWLKNSLGELWGRCVRADRGDSVLMQWRADTVPAEVAIRAVLRLAEAPPSFRTRIAIHIGHVQFDGEGFVGGDLNMTFALNESELLKKALAQANSPVAFLVSDQAHHTVIRHGTAGDPASFHEAIVKVKKAQVNAWLHIPREDALATQIAERSKRPSEEEPAAPSGGVQIRVNRDFKMKGNIAGGNIN